jgi:hypothetical protein
MIVNTHEPDSCGFRSEENKSVLVEGFSRLQEVARSIDAKVEGVWANLASHTVFILVDAPNSHAVDDLLREAHLIGHTDTRVFAVQPMENVLERVK